jgi:integrase/recombinase XerD
MTHQKHDPAIFLNPLDLKTALEAFSLAKRAERKKPYTIRVYQLHVNHFIDYLAEDGILNVLDVTRVHLRDYFVDLQAEHNEGGVHSFYRSIKCFLRWYWDECEIEQVNPIAKVHVSPAQIVPKPGIPMSDFSAMVDACHGKYRDRDRAFLHCLLDSGCRAGEFTRLNIEDVDLLIGKVYIWYSKARRSRIVGFGDRARRLLRKYLRGRGRLSSKEPLFLNDEGERFHTNGLYQLLERRAADAKIETPGLHDFRRRCASEMRKNGSDLRAIQAYLGHSSLAVTERYLALEGDETMENLRKFSPVDHADL